MQYRVKNPTIPLLQELAMLSFNLRWYTIEFRAKLGSDLHRAMVDAEYQLDSFLKANTEPIPGTEKEKL